MGAFFTNVQVFVPEDAFDDARDKVVESVTKAAAADRLEPVENEDLAERSFAFHADPDGRWISVYTDATEDQDSEALDRLAAELSRDAGTTAVSVLVHDSDFLRLNLFVDGESKGVYENDPEFDGESSMPEDARDAVASEWKPLLAGGDDLAKLIAIWGERYVFAEEALGEMEPLVGWEIAHCGVGFNYLEPDADVTRLHFGSPGAKAVEAEETSGPPKITTRGTNFSPPVRAGLPCMLGFGCLNEGGGSKGLKLMLWGDGVDRGFFDWTGGKIYFGAERKPLVFELEPDEDGKTLSAVLPDLELKPQLLYEKLWSKVSPTKYSKLSEEAASRALGIHFTGEARKAGETSLYVAAAPLENPEQGQCSSFAPARIGPHVRRPYRWVGEFVDGMSLIKLAEPTSLFALVALEADNSATTAAVMEALAAWSKLISPVCRTDYQVRLEDPENASKRIQARKLKPSSTQKHKNWRWIADAVEAGWGVTAKATGKFGNTEDEHNQRLMRQVTQGMGPPDMMITSDDHTNGFSFLAREDAEFASGETLSPHVGLWVALEGLAEDDLEKLEAGLTEIVDRLVDSTGAHQAILGKWQYQPDDSHDIKNSPWEMAFGVHGFCTVYDRWCQRFVRGVTPMMWLGEPLIEQLGPLDELEEIADIETVGKCTRLRLRDQNDLARLEELMTPVVSTSDEWERWMEKWRAARAAKKK